MFFNCDYCSFKAASHQFLFYHLVGSHDKFMWACKDCDYISTKKVKVLRHVRGRHLDELITPNDSLDDYFKEFHKVAALPDYFLCYFQKQTENAFKCILCGEVQKKISLSTHLCSQHQPHEFIWVKSSTNSLFANGTSLKYYCKLCPVVCSNISLLSDHIFSLHAINIFSDKVSSPIKLKVNLNISKFYCTECRYNTLTYDNFQAHIKKHGRKLAYKCDYCSMTSDYYAIIKKHKNHWHNKNNLGSYVDRFRCNFCTDRAFDKMRNLKCHMKMKHPNLEQAKLIAEDDDSLEDSSLEESFPASQVYRCEICLLDFQFFQNLVCHCLNVHKKTVVKLQCDQCDFMTNQSSILTAHISASHNEPKNFSTAKERKNNHHPVKRSSERIFECSVCHKKVQGWAYFMNHRKIHINKVDKALKCPHCMFAAKSLAVLKQHMIKHSATPFLSRFSRYSCSSCPYRATGLKNLEKHVNCHKKDCKYNCPDCSYSCNNLSFLRRHSIVHTSAYKAILEPTVFISSGQENPVKVQDFLDSENEEMEMKMEDVVEMAIDKSRLVASKHNIEFWLKNNDAETEKTLLGNKRISYLHCEKCPFISDTVNTFTNHSSCHIYRRAFQCIYCDYSAPSMAFLLVHRNLHYRPNPNLLYAQSTDSLKQMPEATEGETMEEEAVDADLYSKMYEFSPFFTLVPPKTFRCESCPFFSFDRPTFILHLTSHRGDYKFKCKLCTFSSPTKDGLCEHIALHFVLPGSPMSPHLEGQNQQYKETFLSAMYKLLVFDEIGDAEVKDSIGVDVKLGEEDVKWVNGDVDKPAVGGSVSNGKEKEELAPNGDGEAVTNSACNDDVTKENNYVEINDEIPPQKLSSETPLICKYCSRSFDLSSNLISHQSSHTSQSFYSTF